MVNKIFDRKLLEFMYFLTKQQRFMNSQQISKVLTINGKKITDRTIRRWFNSLKKDRNFNYFLNTKQTQMATIPTWVFIKDVCSPKIFGIIPYRTYLIDGVCLKTLKKAYLAQFYVPAGAAKKFELFWAKAKNHGLVGDYSLFQHKPSVSLYQQFHKSLDSNGRVKYCAEPLHQDFLNLLEQTLAEREVRLHPQISKYPVLIPLLCELYGEHFSSHELWKNIKLKLGEGVWNYFPHKIRGKDAAAISYIQRLLKGIYRPPSGLVQQLRVSYTPVYLNNVGIYLFIKLKEPSKFLDFAKDIGNYSVHTVISPSVKADGTHTVYAVTGQETLGSFFEMVNRYIKHNFNNIFLQNIRRTDFNYSKIDYAKCFDPKTCTWRYEHKKYMCQLEKLAKNVK